MIKSSYTERRNRNAAYSLRAFAADLDVSVSTLSEVLSHKKRLARKTALKISTALNLNKREKEIFLLSVDYERPSLDQDKETIAQKLSEHASVGRVLTTRTQHQDLAANPQYVTVLAMLQFKNFRYNLTWISGLLNTFQHETARLFKRLQEVGVIRFNEKNEPEAVKNFILTPDGTQVESIRAYHRATLNQAILAIESVPTPERDYCSTVMAIDQNDLPEIQSEIRAFQQKIFLKYGDRKNANRVYSLQNQFIPLTGRNELKS